MTSAADPFLWSLERAGELGGDLAPRVYALLFERRPEFERLFAMDRQGGVRGSMLANAIDALIDIGGARQYGLGQVLAERANHEAYGAPRSDYLMFFEVIRDVVRETLGQEWRQETEAAWAELLGAITEAMESSPPL